MQSSLPIWLVVARKLAADPAIVKRVEELGITVARGHSAQFTEFVAKQVADRGPAIKAADVKP